MTFSIGCSETVAEGDQHAGDDVLCLCARDVQLPVYIRIRAMYTHTHTPVTTVLWTTVWSNGSEDISGKH